MSIEPRFVIGTFQPGEIGEVWFVQDNRTKELIDQNLTQSEARTLARIQNELESELESLDEVLAGEGDQALAEALSVDLKAPSEDKPWTPHKDRRHENYGHLALTAPSEPGKAFWSARLAAL